MDISDNKGEINSMSKIYCVTYVLFFAHFHSCDSFAIQVRQTHLYRPSVSFQLLHLGEPHNRRTNVPQSVGREVRAGDVFLEGTEVDAGVLLRKSIRRYQN
jgi:hypothetical protein